MLGSKNGGGGDENGGSGRKRLVCRRLAIMIVFPIPTAMRDISRRNTSSGYRTYSLTRMNQRDIDNQ